MRLYFAWGMPGCSLNWQGVLACPPPPPPPPAPFCFILLLQRKNVQSIITAKPLSVSIWNFRQSFIFTSSRRFPSFAKIHQLEHTVNSHPVFRTFCAIARERIKLELRGLRHSNRRDELHLSLIFCYNRISRSAPSTPSKSPPNIAYSRRTK